MSKDENQIQQYKITLPGWGVELTLIITPEGPFLLIRELCAVLGLSSPYQQTARMKEHTVLARRIKQWPVLTRGGRQEAWCIHRRAIGFWLGTIQDTKVRKEVQPRLVDLHEEIIDATDRIIFGEVESDPVRAELARQSGEMADLRRYTFGLEQRIGRIEGSVFLPDNDDE